MDGQPVQGAGGVVHEGEHPSDPTAVWAILMGWLVAAREQITEKQARDAVRWVSDSLGIKHDDLVQQQDSSVTRMRQM
ncbi:hypothetical protein [Streptomyces achromogenes]|uniref:hypothetical protein n=1 Tax=Streptomyces achromogenes TaxID=67255 RepID=UPI0036AC9DD2